MDKCDICKRPIADGDICVACSIRASELHAVYRRRHQAEIDRKQRPLEVDRVPLSVLGVVDTWRDY